MVCRERRECISSEKPDDLLLSHVGWVILAAIVAGGILYFPALNGRFIFDDDALPFRQGIQNASFHAWVNGVRPVLMFSYWVNYFVSGEGSYGFHLLNLLIHCVNAGLVFLVLFRLLSLAGWNGSKRRAAALVGSAVFLVHPLATESVSYVAGRSESLAALFVLLAYAVFLGTRGHAISWSRSIAVMSLFAMAVATKENAAALAGVLLLTDLFWPRPFSAEGVRRNRKLYALMLPAALAGALWVARTLGSAQTAGFSMKGITWYQYALTETRALFAYIRLAVIPLGQSVDHDFPVSHSVNDHGAVVFLALTAIAIAAAILFRRSRPLACFGFLLFLTLLAPTSSVIPIADPFVERRMYLPIVGLILIACEVAGRIRRPGVIVCAVPAILLSLALLCYQRNVLWGRPEQILANAAQESTGNGRPYLGLSEVLCAEKRCAEAIPILERGERLMPNDFAIQVAWGKILECQGKREEAIRRLRRAAEILPASSVYQLIGFLYGEMGKIGEAGQAFQEAARIAPDNSAAHSALGLWYEWTGSPADAEREYRNALGIYAFNMEARSGLARVQGTVGGAAGQGDSLRLRESGMPR
jgi:tetratricopeptide (TPR) repeat protein